MATKIILTEEQYDMLSFVNENRQIMDDYIAQVKNMKTDLNGVLERLNSMTVKDLLGDGDAMGELGREILRIYRLNTQYAKRLNNFFDSTESFSDYEDTWGPLREQFDKIYGEFEILLDVVDHVVSHFAHIQEFARDYPSSASVLVRHLEDAEKLG